MFNLFELFLYQWCYIWSLLHNSIVFFRIDIPFESFHFKFSLVCNLTTFTVLRKCCISREQLWLSGYVACWVIDGVRKCIAWMLHKGLTFQMGVSEHSYRKCTMWKGIVYMFCFKSQTLLFCKCDYLLQIMWKLCLGAKLAIVWKSAICIQVIEMTDDYSPAISQYKVE